MYVHKIYTYQYLHIKSSTYMVMRAWRGKGTHLTDREGLEIKPKNKKESKITLRASNSGFLLGGELSA